MVISWVFSIKISPDRLRRKASVSAGGIVLSKLTLYCKIKCLDLPCRFYKLFVSLGCKTRCCTAFKSQCMPDEDTIHSATILYCKYIVDLLQTVPLNQLQNSDLRNCKERETLFGFVAFFRYSGTDVLYLNLMMTCVGQQIRQYYCMASYCLNRLKKKLPWVLRNFHFGC